MKTLLLTTFVLVGTVDSKDEYFASVELDLNPKTSEGPAHAILPISAFPCDIKEGEVFYVIKLHPDHDPVIQCAPRQKEIKSK